MNEARNVVPTPMAHPVPGRSEAPAIPVAFNVTWSSPPAALSPAVQCGHKGASKGRRPVQSGRRMTALERAAARAAA